MYIFSVTVSSQRFKSPTLIALQNESSRCFLLILACLGYTGGDVGIEQQFTIFFLKAVLLNKITLCRSTVSLFS